MTIIPRHNTGRPAMRVVLALAMLGALGAPARAAGDVGVIVTGEGSIQPQLVAQLEDWLSRHGHAVVPSPLPPDAITALVDCFVLEDQKCARAIVEHRAKSSGVIYARVEIKNASNGTRDVTLTVYWFDRGHEAIAERKICEHCTDQSLRTTADEVMKKLVGGGDLGHVKLKSTPAGARITIDGQAIGVTPLDWDLPPGKHTIQMDKAGLTEDSREILVVSNKTDTLAMVLEPPTADHSFLQSRYLPVGLLAGGGALVATGVILIAINQDAGPQQPYMIRNTAPAGIGLVIGGAVIGGLGAYLMWFRSPDPGGSAPVVALSHDTAYIGWLGRF